MSWLSSCQVMKTYQWIQEILFLERGQVAKCTLVNSVHSIIPCIMSCSFLMENLAGVTTSLSTLTRPIDQCRMNLKMILIIPSQTMQIHSLLQDREGRRRRNVSQ